MGRTCRPNWWRVECARAELGNTGGRQRAVALDQCGAMDSVVLTGLSRPCDVRTLCPGTWSRRSVRRKPLKLLSMAGAQAITVVAIAERLIVAVIAIEMGDDQRVTALVGHIKTADGVNRDA